MMTVGKHKIRSHMTLEYDFTGIRLQEGCFTPVDWKLTVDLIAPRGTTQKSKEDSELKAGMTYNRIHFWLDTNLTNVIVVDATNEDDLYLANLSANITLYCPGDVSDDHVIQLIHSKLSALAAGTMVVGEMQLKGSDTSAAYTFDCPDGAYELPVSPSEYIEGEARDEEAWWFRNDGFCFEFIKPVAAEGETIPEDIFGDIVDPMTEFERMVQEATESFVGIIKEPARIVQVEKWKPKTV